MKFEKHTLKNGLRVIVSSIPSLESATLTVWVKTGSRNEEEKLSGISHFLEHMVFKGSSKRPTAREISSAVDSIGGEFNAGTSKEWTNFYIKARASEIDQSFDVLSDMVLRPLLKEEEIERERGVILEEKAMYEDTPMMKIWDVFENLIFAGTKLGDDIIGKVETIKKIKRNDFLSYRNEYYFSDNIILTISGGVDSRKILELAEKCFGELMNKQAKPIPHDEQLKADKPRCKVIYKKNEQAHLVLGFLGFPRGDETRFVEKVLSTILGGGMSSRLFIEVRERRGLAYSVRTDSDHFIDTGFMGTYAGVKLEKIEEAIDVVLEQHYGISNRKFLVSKEELEKAKGYLKGHLALSLEDTNNINSFVGERELFLNKIETPEQVYENIDKVSLEDVYSLASKMFKPERLNLAIIGPYEDEERFERLLR
jgi:predicted Zn-dependent peptidase